jgi:long-chain acyl-CoA synthetase
MLLDALARNSGPAMRFRSGERWVEWSFAEVGVMATELARGLIALGLRRGDPVAILGGTSPSWTVADCACLAAGATVVPIYQTNSPEECRYVLAHSGARAVICEDAGQLAKVEAVRAECPDLVHVLSFADFTALRERGAAETRDDVLSERLAEIDSGDVATIVYTSGTTGPPKGCMLTHANCLFTARAYERELALTAPMTIFMFLPLAHALARIVQMVSLDAGGTLAYWRGDPRGLLEDLAAARVREGPHAGPRAGCRARRGEGPRVQHGAGHRAPSAAGRAHGRRQGAPARAPLGRGPPRPVERPCPVRRRAAARDDRRGPDRA